ncbi:MAG: DUF4469 domain-containing protein [Treponematales bacterium]
MALEYYIQPNPLTANPDDFRAQVIHARCYTQDEIVDRILKKGSTLNRGALNEAFGLWLETVADILAEGDGIDTKAVVIHLSVKGTFDAEGRSDNMETHASVHLGTELDKARKRAKARRVAPRQKGTVIENITDMQTQAVNRRLTPGGVVKVAGEKVKLAGDDPSVGLYFVNTADGAETKAAAESIVENTAGHILALVPPLAAGTYHARIVTRYAGSGTLLSAPRETTFDKPLTVS